VGFQPSSNHFPTFSATRGPPLARLHSAACLGGQLFAKKPNCAIGTASSATRFLSPHTLSHGNTGSRGPSVRQSTLCALRGPSGSAPCLGAPRNKCFLGLLFGGVGWLSKPIDKRDQPAQMVQCQLLRQTIAGRYGGLLVACAPLWSCAAPRVRFCHFVILPAPF